jgi:hypothetical protein
VILLGKYNRVESTHILVNNLARIGLNPIAGMDGSNMQSWAITPVDPARDPGDAWPWKSEFHMTQNL